MLVLTRKLGEAIRIKPHETLDSNTPVKDLFADGPIEVVVTQIDGPQVKLGIHAHRHFVILRDELCNDTAEKD